MIYEVKAIVNGEEFSIEYPNSTRQEAVRDFKGRYPNAKRLVAVEVRRQRLIEREALVGKEEWARQRAEKLEHSLEARAKRQQADPYYR